MNRTLVFLASCLSRTAARHLLRPRRKKIYISLPLDRIPWVGFIHVSALRTASNKKRSEGEDETGEREDVQYEEHQVVACKIQTRCLTQVLKRTAGAPPLKKEVYVQVRGAQ